MYRTEHKKVNHSLMPMNAMHNNIVHKSSFKLKSLCNVFAFYLSVWNFYGHKKAFILIIKNFGKQ